LGEAGAAEVCREAGDREAACRKGAGLETA